MKVAIWTPAGLVAGKCEVGSRVDKFCEEVPPELMESKIESLKETLKENPAWPGASAGLSGGCDLASSEIPQEKSVVADAGSSPRLFAQNKWAWRCGAQAWANPGLGGFAKAESESIGLKLLEIAQVVGHGISLNDLGTFLESETGADVLNKSMCVPVKKGEIVWIPYGLFVVPVSAHEIRDKDSAEPPTPEEEVGTAFVLAMNTFVPEWAKKLDYNSWRAIVALNRAWFDKNKAKNLWADRATVFEAFVKAVEKL